MPTTAEPISEQSLGEFTSFGKFVTSDGKSFPLVTGLRDKLKPEWRDMLIPIKGVKQYKIGVNGDSTYSAESRANRCNRTFVGKHVLEVGCYLGSHAYTMAKFEDTTVHGIDILEYGIHQTVDLTINPEDLNRQEELMNSHRKQIGLVFPEKIRNKVTFATQDVLALEDKAVYDAIYSLDVLEHISNPQEGIRRMARALKSGGFMYHEFNSFFSIIGGHSLCTLDFPFAHCMLTSEDFDRYIKEVRPEEEKPALGFYHNNLNRMGLVRLKQYCEECGLTITLSEAHQPFPNNSGWDKQITDLFLPMVQRIYPDVIFNDMFYDITYLVMEKQ